ncbi:WD40-repeat-containing domain protein, partial [Trichoderma sp. SZMC 28015]
MERTAPSILELTQSCISKFEQLLAAQRPGYIGPLENRLADFTLWADGLGALAKPGASLDSRLQGRARDLKLVQNVLIMLADSLDYLKNLTDADVHFTESIQNIDSVLENLALISVAIRRTGKASRNRRANQSFNPSEHQELKKHLECVILLRPTKEALFRKTEDGDFITKLDASQLSDLQQRLIQANLRRRHNFLVAQKHSIAQKAPQARTSADQLSLPIRSLLQTEPIAKVQKVAHFQNSSPITTSDLAIRSKNTGAPTISGYSVASTAEGTLKLDSAINKYAPGIARTQITLIASNADFPKAPSITLDQNISKCPCCCQSIPSEVFRHPKEWKQHIIEDLCPYTCIAENCPTPHLLFCTRDEWETHVKKSHLPQWQCPFCEEQEDYPTMESMGGHLQDHHEEEFLENSFSTLLSWSAVQRTGIKSCPLCSSSGVEDSPELVNHVLQHTYEFALRSLPWPQPIIHNLNVPPGGFDLSVNLGRAEEFQLEDIEDIRIYHAEDGRRLTPGNLQRLEVEGIRHWTADDIQLWINEEVHERQEPPELQLTNYDRADHSALDHLELLEYSNYFVTNQYFGDGSNEDKSSKPQRDESTDWITVSTDTDRSAWNEAGSLEMRVITVAGNEVDGEEELKVLLKGEEGNIVVTKGIVEAAACNKACGKQVMRLLIIQPVEHIIIKDEAVASVAQHFDEEMMALLLDRRGDHLTITEEIIEAAKYNFGIRNEVVELLLEKQAKQESNHMGDVHPPPTLIGLGSLELDAVAPHHKKSGDDWHIIFNPQVQRVLDVDLVHTLRHDSVVASVRFSQDGRYIATGSNGFARIFEVSTGEEIHRLECDTPNMPDGNYVRSVCFSPDGKYLATTSEDAVVRVWNIETETLRNRFLGHTEHVLACDFAYDGQTVASVGRDRTVRLWNIDTGANTLTITIDDATIAVAFSRESQYIAVGSLDKTIYVWEFTTGLLAEHLKGPGGHRDGVYSIAFSPDGKGLVSGSLDRTIKMWELGSPRSEASSVTEDGKCVRTLQGHNDFVLSVALSPDSLWVISGSKDSSAQFWDSKTGVAQFMVKGHTKSVISVASSPRGGYFATGGGDKKACIWAYHPYGAD